MHIPKSSKVHYYDSLYEGNTCRTYCGHLFDSDSDRVTTDSTKMTCNNCYVAFTNKGVKKKHGRNSNRISILLTNEALEKIEKIPVYRRSGLISKLIVEQVHIVKGV